MKNWLKNYTTQLLENLRKEKCTHLLQRIWSEYVFVITKVKNIVPWTYVINDLNNEETVGTFYEEELQKANKKRKNQIFSFIWEFKI